MGQMLWCCMCMAPMASPQMQILMQSVSVCWTGSLQCNPTKPANIHIFNEVLFESCKGAPTLQR